MRERKLAQMGKAFLEDEYELAGPGEMLNFYGNIISTYKVYKP